MKIRIQIHLIASNEFIMNGNSVASVCNYRRVTKVFNGRSKMIMVKHFHKEHFLQWK